MTDDGFPNDACIVLYSRCFIHGAILVWFCGFAESMDKVASRDDNLLGKNRKVIKTARGFLMTVDSC